MLTKILYIFTRTPLHVGAGSSVGAIDQPIQRERHTGFPIIPASALKGSFADQWNDTLLDEENDSGEIKKVRVKKDGTSSISGWLFGSDSDKNAASGCLILSEARVLAFPIRSARGSFAWITCPLMLQRAARDGVLKSGVPPEPKDEQAVFKTGDGSKLGLPGDKIVLEEYCFSQTGNYPTELAKEISELIRDDLFKTITDRLVILSNGMMTHFVTTACEVAQHVRISDETGTADGGALFNQENVPSETLFYSVLNATKGRGDHFKAKTADEALTEFYKKVREKKVFQFGGDASTGLGFCSASLNEVTGE